MTKVTQFVLAMAGEDGVPVEIGTCQDAYSPLLATTNSIATALSIVKFRGVVTFTIASRTGDKHWGSVVTFTDDNPQGFWNTTNYQ